MQVGTVLSLTPAGNFVSFYNTRFYTPPSVLRESQAGHRRNGSELFHQQTDGRCIGLDNLYRKSSALIRSAVDPIFGEIGEGRGELRLSVRNVGQEGLRPVLSHPPHGVHRETPQVTILRSGQDAQVLTTSPKGHSCDGVSHVVMEQEGLTIRRVPNLDDSIL